VRVLRAADARQSPSPISAFVPQDEWIIPPIMIPFMDQVVAWVRRLPKTRVCAVMMMR
jgi:hypothetical protein